MGAGLAALGAGAPPGAGELQDIPLWRVQWAVLPGTINTLHVHVPHYGAPLQPAGMAPLPSAARCRSSPALSVNAKLYGCNGIASSTLELHSSNHVEAVSQVVLIQPQPQRLGHLHLQIGLLFLRAGC